MRRILLPLLSVAALVLAAGTPAAALARPALPAPAPAPPEPAPAVDQLGHRPSQPPPAIAPGPGLPARAAPAADLPADWSLLGPPGGDAYDVAVSPVDPELVLAGTAPAGSFGGSLYRSTDGAGSWTKEPALAGTSVFDIEFTPTGTAFLGTIDGIWRSDDGGASWTRLELGIGANQATNDIALDPSDPAVLWAGIGDGFGTQPVNLIQSTDGGASWTDRTPPHPAPINGSGVAVDPTDPDTVIAVFAGSFGGGEVWVTTDGGDSWTDRSAGLPDNPIDAVAYDGSRLLVGGGQLFGSQHVGLFSSADLGANWAPLHDASWPIPVIDDIAVDPADPDTILVATDANGVHRTTDGGQSWEIGVGGSQSLAGRSLRFAPGSSTELLLGTSSLAVFRSADGGDSFSQTSTGISELGLTSIAANPQNPDELAVAFEGQNDGGVLTSTDAGGGWELEPVPPTRYSAVRYAPDGTLYAISDGPSSIAPEGLYRRDAGGWVPLGPDQGTLFESELSVVRFSETDPDLIMMAGNDFGVAGSEATVWRTTDQGGSWTKVYEQGESAFVTDLQIVADGTNQRMLAVWFTFTGGPVGGALRSTDGGQSWSDANNGLPGGFFRDARLCGSPSDPEVGYLSTWTSFDGGALFRTGDAGQSWQATGWAGPRIHDLACDPVDDQVLYLSQGSGDAVVRSADAGVTFQPYATGLAGVTNPGQLAFAGDGLRLLLASRQGSFATTLREPPPSAGCDQTITGVHPGPLTVTGGLTCLAAGSQVLGEVNVTAGAGLIGTAAVIQGPVSAIGATVLELRFSQVTGPVLVLGATGSVSLFGSQVTGSVSVLNSTTEATVSGNTVIGTLSCFGNQPPPTDHGLPNTATGGKLGQCTDL